MHDTTSIMEDYTNAWEGHWSGRRRVLRLLGAPEQVDRIRDLYATYPSALRVVEPVTASRAFCPTHT